ncbi:hypothetical protein KC19_9G078100 [Ceratodon purpureus]|uniref:Uncharacterized protein n=1 Tax=Ceratodon purpureus TaxID=3225 RepID=A0A8T0GPT1_CERPU|nr:hypothetical protein KC19_9G078100 [Ceratodon purpureus]
MRGLMAYCFSLILFWKGYGAQFLILSGEKSIEKSLIQQFDDVSSGGGQRGRTWNFTCA